MALPPKSFAERPGTFSRANSGQDKLDTSSKKPSTTPSTSDRLDRTSFSSIKESSEGGAQSFTDSKVSSYLRHQFRLDGSEEAIADDGSSSSGARTPPKIEETPSMIHSHSDMNDFICPCSGFRGWKSISIRGKVASRSSGDLRKLAMGYDWYSKDTAKLEKTKLVVPTSPPEAKQDRGCYAAGQSPFEELPTELLGNIIDQLATDIPPNGFTARNVDLMSLLLTSHGVHSATLATLYCNITIPHSRIFAKFLAHVTEYSSLGTIVRRLDFCHFNPRGAGVTMRERQNTMNLIPETILKCLDLTPNLRDFLAQEHIEDDMDARVLRKLFCGLPKLKALDFCACSSTKFKSCLMEVIEAKPAVLPTALPMTRISFHECTALPASTYSILLPRLSKLTHLDVAHTRITDAALHSISETAQLTHLNLSKCSALTGSSVVDFLINHPAAKTLVYLNLGMDSKSSEILSSEDIIALLPALPPSLRSLSLKGSVLGPTHVPLLLPLTKHLEELGLGRLMGLSDITRLFVPEQNAEIEEQLAWVPHQLRYIDASDLSSAALDLTTLFGLSCPMLTNITVPLEVIELRDDVDAKLKKSSAVMKRIGAFNNPWSLREAGRRHWLVRDFKTGEHSGARDWKWGATYWGMKKVPVVRAEVGGMYGHYMFKR
ncbi:hypothetical protein BJ878DRAFT_442670 [Calycina marina]|uniref:Uncharacterized protein n=1 Tax=Calycina marina TaxID=1763456 RepID=A0A9P7Z1Q8_9HELO|nr:hypothetical protein BJ878DRAFT_442670 [Calycina marina]